MKFLVIGAIIGCAAFVPRIIGQNQPTEQKHLTFRTKSANIVFAADNVLRQDPAPSNSSSYASAVRLRGNVRVRTCCVQIPIVNGEKVSALPLKQVVLMQADEVDFREDTGEMEVRGNVRVNFQNYKYLR